MDENQRRSGTPALLHGADLLALAVELKHRGALHPASASKTAAGRMSVSALHEAVLDDGRRVVLLDDRGWTGQLSAAVPHKPGIGAFETIEGLECEARDVVGPDEPVSGLTHADTDARHWATLAGILHEHDVDVEPAALSELPLQRLSLHALAPDPDALPRRNSAWMRRAP